MSAFTGTMPELVVALHRHTDAATLTKLASEHAAIEFPVSGDMLSIMQRDTLARDRRRRLNIEGRAKREGFTR